MMKKNTLFIYFFLSCFLFLSACKREEIRISTGEVSKIFPTSVTVTGRLISLGDGIKQYGHCYARSPNPTISENKTEFGAAIGLGDFTSYLAGLEPGTEYFVKAYVNCDRTTVYGKEISFTTTTAGLPVLTTTIVTDISEASAISGGLITSDGGTPVLTRGVCWNISASPTIEHSKTTNGSGTGIFSSTLSELKANTIYYVRAYATNGAGTSYGNEYNFTTVQ